MCLSTSFKEKVKLLMARGTAQTDSSASKQTKNVNSKKRPNEEQTQTLSKKQKAKNEGKTAQKTGKQSCE